MRENMGEIWWRHLTRPSRFVNDVSEALLDEDSVLLILPERMPWYWDFYAAVEESVNERSALRSMQMIESPAAEIGEFLFETECRKELRSRRRRGQSYASFLAGCDDLTLNNKYIWVRGTNADKLAECRDFLAEYYKARPRDKTRPLFILEMTEGMERVPSVKGMRQLRYSAGVGAYDRFAFCAMAAANAGVSPEQAPYLSELISNLCRDDVELCGICAEMGEQLLQNPVSALASASAENLRSDDTPFHIPDADTLARREWESQLKIVYPMVQRYVSQFIDRHRTEITKALPIETQYDTIDDPQDLELSHLLGMAGAQALKITGREYEELTLLRRIRNRLAHMRSIDANDMKRLMEGDFEFSLV